MKTELVDVTPTRKQLVVEIPSETVDGEIERLAKDYSRAARIPGFRPGKVPARVVKQRFRDQILHDVAHELIPRAVDSALRERGVEPVDTPDIRDVVVEEGRPLKFTAAFDTVPPIDPGDYASMQVRRPTATVEAGDVDDTLQRLRERSARFEPVEGRRITVGDSVVVDLTRHTVGSAAAEPERHENVTIDVGASANPPGFDQQLVGLDAGANKTFTVRYPADYAISELADREVEYSVAIKAIRRRIVPELDDEFAKDVGNFENLAELRERVAGDLRHEREHDIDREVRSDLLKQLAARVTFDVPDALVERELDRRIDEFVRRLIEQQIDPRRANVDWEELRKSQREPAIEAVAAALVLDEVARREKLVVSDEEVEAEIARYAERAGRTVPAVRAQLEKENGISKLYAGLRREKAVDFLLAHATIVPESSTTSPSGTQP